MHTIMVMDARQKRLGERRARGPVLELNVRTLTWIASLIAVLYGLNRPVQAFNTLSASVDKLAAAVSRIDITQAEQTKALDDLRSAQAAMQATSDQRVLRLTADEARIAAIEGRR